MSKSRTILIKKNLSSSKVFGAACTLALSLPLSAATALANPAAVPGAFQNHSALMPAVHATTQIGSHAIAAPQTNTVHHTSAAFTALRFFPALTHNASATLANPSSTGGANLNLTSTQQRFLAGNLGNFSNLTIDVGGHTETVTLNTRLTAAEVVAVEQVMNGGKQSIVIGANGAASGGSINLSPDFLKSLDSGLGGSLASMTIAHNVTVVDSVSNLTFSGNFSNYGAVQTASTTSGATDTISARNVVNANGANISSYGGTDLYGADVALAAIKSIANDGTISSAHNLNITAPSISNTGLIAAGSGNINVASNNIGAGGSSGGSSTGDNLNVVGTGTWQASNGNINLATNNADINLNGGNWLSQQLNFNAGTGQINGAVGQLTGVVNSSGGGAHILADTGTLTLGNNCVSGDPTYVNTGGDISIVGTVSETEDLAIIAKGNIDIGTAGSTALIVDNGHNVTLIAGATISKISVGAPTTTSLPGISELLPGQKVTVTFGGNAGKVDLTTNNIAVGNVIDTTGLAGNTSGGNVTIISNAPAAGGGGVDIPSIATGGSGTGANGNVTIISANSTGVAINAPLVSTEGGSGKAGSLALTAMGLLQATSKL
jgi:hypothetical protein